MTAATTPLGPITGRDYRVDFWRGIALAMIFVNHIPGNLFENYTTRNFGFSDAAELFVFLAGFASAYAYAPLYLAGHRLVASIKAWRRAGILYLVHVTLTTLAFGIFAWGALAFGEGDLINHIGLELASSRPIETLIGVPALGHQLGYVNILPMYSVMLLMLPIHLALVAIDRRLMLGAAIVLLADNLHLHARPAGLSAARRLVLQPLCLAADLRARPLLRAAAQGHGRRRSLFAPCSTGFAWPSPWPPS